MRGAHRRWKRRPRRTGRGGTARTISHVRSHAYASCSAEATEHREAEEKRGGKGRGGEGSIGHLAAELAVVAVNLQEQQVAPQGAVAHPRTHPSAYPKCVAKALLCVPGGVLCCAHLLQRGMQSFRASPPVHTSPSSPARPLRKTATTHKSTRQQRDSTQGGVLASFLSSDYPPMHSDGKPYLPARAGALDSVAWHAATVFA